MENSRVQSFDSEYLTPESSPIEKTSPIDWNDTVEASLMLKESLLRERGRLAPDHLCRSLTLQPSVSNYELASPDENCNSKIL